MSGYAKGADIGWLTEMEKSGVSFYDSQGHKKECLSLLRSLGMNSVRLRVWVNPKNGWCNKEDMLVKAIRANNLGMRIMVDFHYSDSWADPGQQNKPAAWEGLSFEDLKKEVALHTTDVLSLLKDRGITPEWIQIGNETGNGMLWEDGKAENNMAGYAALTSSGYDAAKSIFPDSKIIVHLQEGDKRSLYVWLFDGLKQYGAKWDVIGMSLYPEADNYESVTNDCIDNISYLANRYSTEVMICEVGMNNDQAETCKLWLTSFIAKTRAINSCLGIFYWAPQCFTDWNGYSKGAFNTDGTPTVALDAFAD